MYEGIAKGLAQLRAGNDWGFFSKGNRSRPHSGQSAVDLRLPCPAKRLEAPPRQGCDPAGAGPCVSASSNAGSSRCRALLEDQSPVPCLNGPHADTDYNRQQTIAYGVKPAPQLGEFHGSMPQTMSAARADLGVRAAYRADPPRDTYRKFRYTCPVCR